MNSNSLQVPSAHLLSTSQVSELQMCVTGPGFVYIFMYLILLSEDNKYTHVKNQKVSVVRRGAKRLTWVSIPKPLDQERCVCRLRSYK